MLLTTPDGGILEANPAAQAMFGQSEQQMRALGRDGLVDVSDPRLPGYLEQRARNGFARGELTCRRGDGSAFPVEVSSRVFSDSEGRLRTAMVVRDLTQRMQAEEDIRRSERKYRTLYQSQRDGIASVDLQGRITDFNRAFRDMLGHPAAEIYRLTYEDITPARWRQMEADILREQVLTRGYSGIYEKEYRRQDGPLIPVELRTYLLRDERGQPTGFWAIVRDISQRQRAEEDLRLAARVFDKTSEGVMVTDSEGRVRMVNPAFTAITGYPPEEVLGQEPLIFRSGDFEPEFYERLWEDLTTRGQWSGEIMNRRKDDQGQVTNYLAVFHDITKIRSGEENIRYQAFHDNLTGLPNRLLFRFIRRMAG